MLRLILILICIAISSCALPTEEVEPQTFVPDDELRVVSYVREGLTLFRRSRFVDAEFMLRKAYYLAPESPSVLANLAVVLRVQEQFEESHEIYQRLLLRDPNSVEYLVGRAKLLVAEGRSEIAFGELDRALSLARSRLDLQSANKIARSVAALSFELGLEESALCHTMLAWELAKNPEELLRHTRVLLATHRYEEAQKIAFQFALQPAMQANPKAMFATALVAFANEKHKESREYALRAVEQSLSDRSIVSEAELLLSGLDRVDPVEVIEDELEEEDLEEVEDALLQFYNGEPLSSPLALYWPIGLLELVSTAIREEGDLRD